MVIAILPLSLSFGVNDPDTLWTGQMLKLSDFVPFDGSTLKKCDVFSFTSYKVFICQEDNFVWRWFWRETQNISNLNKIKSIFKENFLTLELNSAVCGYSFGLLRSERISDCSFLKHGWPLSSPVFTTTIYVGKMEVPRNQHALGSVWEQTRR